MLYEKGQATRLDFGPTVTSPSFVSINTQGIINNQGIIAGRTGDPYNGARGFRFNPRTGEATLLDPVPPDNLAWGMGINNRGDVLGYSFCYPCANGYHERVGVWDRNGHFKTYFDETISSFDLLFNDNNLIVITAVPDPGPGPYYKNSYLVPRPGVRLNLASLVENLPSGARFSYIAAINNHGDMLGYDYSGSGSFSFLLQRIGATGPQSFSTPDETTRSPAAGRRHEIPPAMAAMLLRHLPPLKSDSALR